MSVGQFLEGLGLGKYAEAFAREDVSWATLRTLSESDLKDFGMSLGHRRALLDALRARAASPGAAQTAADARIAELEDEVRRLRARVAELESGLDYDPHAVKILHVERNPVTNAEIARLTAENAALRAELASLKQQQQHHQTSIAPAPPPAPAPVVPSLDPGKHAQRLKELFAAQVRTFREFIGAALGFQITETRLHEYHLLSVYAERKQDEIVLLFDNGKLQLVETEFALRQRNNEAVWVWLSRNKSVPGFLAQLTLQLLESTTVV